MKRKVLSLLLTLALCLSLVPMTAMPVHADGTPAYVSYSLNGSLDAGGWLDNAIKVVKKADQSLVYTLDTPSSTNGTMTLEEGVEYQFIWVKGSSVYGSYNFSYGGNVFLKGSSNDFNNFPDGKILFEGSFPITYYDLYIANTQVNSANANDLSMMINGVDVAAGGEAKYDSTTNTLTLKDASIDGASHSSDGNYATIAVMSSINTLNINFDGNNTIGCESNTNGMCNALGGLYTNFVFTGADDNAVLTINARTTATAENGAVRCASFTVNKGTVNCVAPEEQYTGNNYKNNPYGMTLNASSGDLLTVNGGKLVCKGWAPIVASPLEGRVAANTQLKGSENYDGTNLSAYDYDTNGYYSSGKFVGTYRYVEATPVTPITVFFEVDGGQVSPASKSVMSGETYGEFPAPQKDGFAFDGWILCEGGGVRLIDKDYWTKVPLFRLATAKDDQSWDGNSYSNFLVGNTIVFDVTFNDTTPTGLEINDRNVASSLYTIDGNHIYGRIEIISDYINGRHHFMDIITANLSSDYTIDKFYVIDPNGKTAITADSTVAMSETHALLAKWVPAYTVNIGPGKYMSLDSGTESQTVLDGSAMTDVVYKADEGYYFPADYETVPVNGIGVTRNSFTQITVSGTPTANTTFYPADATAKTKPATPSVVATDCTTESNDDGTITGVDNTMEYQKSGDTAWTAITGSTVEGLTPGAYSVRIAETDTTLASDAASVSIAEYVVVPKVDAPAFTPASGTTFTESLDITISIPDNATVYYTTDKSDPSETNGIMTTGAAITLTETTTLKAIAISTDANYDNSAIVTATYSKTTPSTGGGGGASSQNKPSGLWEWY